MRVQKTNKSLYKLNEDGRTPWEEAAYQAAANLPGLGITAIHLEVARELILAMDTRSIVYKDTITLNGTGESTHLERFNTFDAISDIPERIKEPIQKAFLNERLAPWVIEKCLNCEVKTDQ